MSLIGSEYMFKPYFFKSRVPMPVLYHGTSGFRYKNIMEQGLHDGSWLTEHLATAQAISHKEPYSDGSRPVVLEVTLPAGWDLTDMGLGDWCSRRGIPNRYIKEIKTS